MISSVHGPGVRLFLFNSIRPRLLALFIVGALRRGNENGNHFLISGGGCWKKTLKTGLILFYFFFPLVSSSSPLLRWLLTFRFVDLSPRAEDVRYKGNLKKRVKSNQFDFSAGSLCVSLSLCWPGGAFRGGIDPVSHLAQLTLKTQLSKVFI